MKRSFTSAQLADYLVAAVLAAVPFHAFLTVWGSSLLGHYTLLRLWDDAALLVVLGIACGWVARDAKLRAWLTGSLLVRLIAAYAGLTILLGFVSLVKGDVEPKALAYGLLINLRYLAWFLGVLLAAQRSSWLRTHWAKLLLIPAAVVVAFAALQCTILPHDFLAHFGYSANKTVAPIETINHNAHYIRVQSTLRGANPLGAYLVVVLAALGTLLLRGKRKVICTGLGAVALLALYASGSRSAWIGAALSLLAVCWVQFKTRRQRLYFGGAGVLVGLLALVGYMLLQNNTSVQNALFHTQDNSRVAISSNDAHESALRSGVQDVLHQPLGDGPGTAGPASVHNAPHPSRIAENYYVQIAQETGWLGLALFVAILALVALELYGQMGVSRLALITLTSLVGVSLVNLLSHAWADDTLAYVWWGLAAIALAKPQKK